ncbi:response regulator [Desulfoprunum benzoelyticum]|uniref:histidine kinase n=1 Tax=Desulfoprunum benzoelyticum TaxID=1506996 RepID=A0A840V5C7_9BACT|nr:ATP-binding protein [Desulfoprunum benzoelyticum]MBB5348949.1 signal transduction histidine kinase/CheY-like chemotaxis protein [Desulfoprunum benzoelyticum]MBM9530799.1 response regulator [Desulfoprunum benzoelyticum]
MLDNYDENKPLYGSRGISVYLKLIKQKYSHVNIVELLKYAEMELYQIEDKGHFFSQRQINRFYEKLVELTGNRKIAREAGRFASSPELESLLGRSVISLISPVKYYEILGKYARAITRSSKYEAKILSSNKAEIIVTPYPGTKEEPFQCENRIGYWEATSTWFKLKPPQISHPECIFKGGKACRYIVSWPKSPVTILKTLRNVTVGLFFLLCAVFLSFAFLNNSAHFTYSTFIFLYAGAITSILLINLFLNKAETRNLMETIILLRDSSDELTEQIDINYENSMLINEIGQALARQSEIEALFTEIINVLHRRLDYDRILIMLATPDRTRLNYKAGFGYQEDQEKILNKLSFHLDNPGSKGIFYVSFRDRIPILLNDIHEIKDDLSKRSLEFALKMGVKSMICCPIIYEEESLGILAVDNIISKRPLVQRDMNLLMGVALQIGSRLQNIKLESQIRQIQKMEAVGNLAGGIAHDFNNILTTILGYSQMINLKLNSEDPIFKMAESIHHAGLKASGLTKQLLIFSRKQAMETKVTNLNIIVEDMSKMLTRLIGEDIQIKTFLSNKIGSIMADASQVGQILMNLVVNARDAMPHGGSLIIETSDVFIDSKYAQRGKFLKEGYYSMLSVTDSGEGIDPESRDKIFEPFYTTKEVGKGTGLGLAIVYGIVKQHNGHIDLYSELNHGTCFKIYFPIVKQEIEATTIEESLELAHGNETILVVDDDDSIRKMIVDTLQPLGYTTLAASCATEALELSKLSKNKIDLILSDVIMPGMNGPQLVEAIKEDQPDIHVILISGYTDNAITHLGALQNNYTLLNKPLMPTSIAMNIRNVLDKKNSNLAETAIEKIDHGG